MFVCHMHAYVHICNKYMNVHRRFGMGVFDMYIKAHTHTYMHTDVVGMPVYMRYIRTYVWASGKVYVEFIRMHAYRPWGMAVWDELKDGLNKRIKVGSLYVCMHASIHVSCVCVCVCVICMYAYHVCR
jgi:hypothetical protein